MTRTTVIVEKYSTAAGSVDVRIQVDAEGNGDAVAKVDGPLVSHIVSRDSSLQPVSRETKAYGTNSEDETREATEDEFRK